MSTSKFNASLAIQNAQKALQSGDNLSARRWAEMAASLAPGQEEPWLLLATLSSPSASVRYLNQALKINPNSERARKGLEWARKRVVTPLPDLAKTAPHPVTQPSNRTQQTQPIRRTTPQGLKQIDRPAVRPIRAAAIKAPAIRRSILLVTMLAIACLMIGFFVAFPGESNVLALIPARLSLATETHLPAWAPVNIAKPTYTPTATTIFTPTSTPTATSTSIPTTIFLPSATFTETPTSSPVPTFAEALVEISAVENATPTALPTDTALPQPTNQPYVPPAQQPAPQNPGGKWILVDISQQHLYAYQGDTLVYSFVASTGMGNSTRVGTFQVLDKIPNAYGANWNIWMPNWLGIYYSGSLENGIHALPILPNGQRLWAGYLGTPISYGCVVLGAYESQLLYDWAEIGTPVNIQW